MIKIYCLINPYNDRPFYVGATKLPLKVRLSHHLTDAKAILPNYWNRKHYLLNYLLSGNKRPSIQLLHECTLQSVDHYEELFYKMLKQQGFRLLQENSFSYTQKHRIGNLINQYSKLKNHNTSLVKIN